MAKTGNHRQQDEDRVEHDEGNDEVGQAPIVEEPNGHHDDDANRHADKLACDRILGFGPRHRIERDEAAAQDERDDDEQDDIGRNRERALFARTGKIGRRSSARVDLGGLSE